MTKKTRNTGIVIFAMSVLLLVNVWSTPNSSTTKDYTSGTVGLLRYIPAGKFQRDKTGTNVSILTKPYRMSQYEITRKQFMTVMGFDPSSDRVSASGAQGDEHPVHNVNWYQAISFCNKLSIKEGLQPVYSIKNADATEVDWKNLTQAKIPVHKSRPTAEESASYNRWNEVTCDMNKNGYRLPTETEWMWAAMGAPADGQNGSKNTSGYTKPFAGSTNGNNIADYVVYEYYDNPDGAEQAATQGSNPAGSKTGGANELGLYDMSGNVSEWCWDWYDSYPDGELIDSKGADSGTFHSVRGGSWFSSVPQCAVANRSKFVPVYRDIVLGFRVVRP